MLAIFMGGMAAGAWLAGRRARSLADPLAGYPAACRYKLSFPLVERLVAALPRTDAGNALHLAAHAGVNTARAAPPDVSP